MANEAHVRCELDSPNRCQNVSDAKGQCVYEAVDGGTNCLSHGGNKQLEAQRNKSMRNYRLTQWQAKLQSKSESSGIKGLREEIGILRIIMEERLNMCKDETDLMLHSAQISDLAMKLERLVTSCHKLEGSMGQLLDKAALLQFAALVIEIIGTELEGQDNLMNTIADKICAAVGETEGELE